MAVFSTNQTRQFYVVPIANIGGADAIGRIEPVYNATDNTLYYKYKGADGTTMRSDIINVNNIKSATYTLPGKMARNTKAVGIKLAGDVVVGQPHLIKVTFKNFVGLSDEYTTSVIADFTPKTSSKEDLYKSLAITLAKSLSKFVTPLAEVYVNDGSVNDFAPDHILVKADTNKENITGADGLIIVAAKQPHTVGTGTNDLVDFEVTLTPVTVNGMDAPWGEVDTKYFRGHKVTNGEIVADMENFYMKERGDQYGNVGWPNVVPTTYLADPTIEYSIFDIVYSYVGENESCQESMKQLTIALGTDVDRSSSLGSCIPNVQVIK